MDATCTFFNEYSEMPTLNEPTLVNERIRSLVEWDHRTRHEKIIRKIQPKSFKTMVEVDGVWSILTFFPFPNCRSSVYFSWLSSSAYIVVCVWSTRLFKPLSQWTCQMIRCHLLCSEGGNEGRANAQGGSGGGDADGWIYVYLMMKQIIRPHLQRSENYVPPPILLIVPYLMRYLREPSRNLSNVPTSLS